MPKGKMTFSQYKKAIREIWNKYSLEQPRYKELRESYDKDYAKTKKS